MVDRAVGESLKNILHECFSDAAELALTNERGLQDFNFLEEEVNRNLFIFHFKDQLGKKRARGESILETLNVRSPKDKYSTLIIELLLQLRRVLNSAKGRMNPLYFEKYIQDPVISKVFP